MLINYEHKIGTRFLLLFKEKIFFYVTLFDKILTYTTKKKKSRNV